MVALPGGQQARLPSHYWDVGWCPPGRNVPTAAGLPRVPVSVSGRVVSRTFGFHSLGLCFQASAPFAKRYIYPLRAQQRHPPDKALDLLDEACARARIPTISTPADLNAGLVVTARTVAEVLAGWVGVPAEGLLDSI